MHHPFISLTLASCNFGTRQATIMYHTILEMAGQASHSQWGLNYRCLLYHIQKGTFIDQPTWKKSQTTLDDPSSNTHWTTCTIFKLLALQLTFLFNNGSRIEHWSNKSKSKHNRMPAPLPVSNSKPMYFNSIEYITWDKKNVIFLPQPLVLEKNVINKLFQKLNFLGITNPSAKPSDHSQDG